MGWLTRQDPIKNILDNIIILYLLTAYIVYFAWAEDYNPLRKITDMMKPKTKILKCLFNYRKYDGSTTSLS